MWAFLARKANAMMLELIPAGVQAPPKSAPNMIAIIMALPKLLSPGLASTVLSRPSTSGSIMATTAISSMNMEMIKDIHK